MEMNVIISWNVKAVKQLLFSLKSCITVYFKATVGIETMNSVIPVSCSTTKLRSFGILGVQTM